MHGLVTHNREEALEEYHTFTFTDAEDNSKFEAYCSPKKKVTYENYLFFPCTQNGQTIDAFITDLSLKAKSFCVE